MGRLKNPYFPTGAVLPEVEETILDPEETILDLEETMLPRWRIDIVSLLSVFRIRIAYFRDLGGRYIGLIGVLYLLSIQFGSQRTHHQKLMKSRRYFSY